MRFHLLLFVFVFCVQAIFSQNQAPERKKGEIIVQFRPKTDYNALFPPNSANRGQEVFFQKEILADNWGIVLLGFDENILSSVEALAMLRKNPAVQSAQFNHRTTERDTDPNDANWISQWDMSRIKAPAAWDVTTGGLTAQGDTIVVAILEKGYQPTHPDLAPNLWYNWREIPNNGIDDDGNGFIDDFRGFDVRNNGDGTGTNSSHGTSVMGIAGAKGNNGIGVSGVLWDVKIMPFVFVEYETEIIKAYNYVAKARDRYNKTNGAQGAFVVASNASFGIDRERPSDHPIWCAVYDSCGVVGVLNTGGTTNQPLNVDVEGDMPTTCPSEYLVSVTNTKQDDMLGGSGFGDTHIDLGAPGTGSHTTIHAGTTSSYGSFGGTSAATPHVTGSIALLYALPCPALSQNSLSDPAGTARVVRNLILENVAPNASLQGKTTTGGRLDIGAAMAEAERIYCNEARGDLSLEVKQSNLVQRSETNIRYAYVVPDFTFSHKVLVYSMNGQLVYESKLTPQAFQDNSFDIPTYNLAAGKYAVMLFSGLDYVVEYFLKI